MEEVWKDILDSPLYEVSNLGNVRHKKRKHNLTPRICVKSYGYECYQVHIANVDGKQRNQKIARLVAIAFLSNPENKPQVDHIDRDPSNNKLNNLRWVTASENLLNCNLRKDNTSGHAGISFSKQKQKWKIDYHYQHIKYHGGFYSTYKDAIANYFNPYKELLNETTATPTQKIIENI